MRIVSEYSYSRTTIGSLGGSTTRVVGDQMTTRYSIYAASRSITESKMAKRNMLIIFCTPYGSD